MHAAAASATWSCHGPATIWTPIGNAPEDPARTTTHGQPVRLCGVVYRNDFGASGATAGRGATVAMPQKCAGNRRLPPESLPNPQGDIPDAMAAASPPLLPAGERASS